LRLTRSLVLRYEQGVEHHEEVVLITTKGEAIALGIAQMVSSPTMKGVWCVLV